MVEAILKELKNYRFYRTIAYRYVKSKEDAEDVLQNVCTKIVREHLRIHSPKKLRSWIAITCSREAISMVRTKKRMVLSDNALIHESELTSSYGPEDIEFYYENITNAALMMVPIQYRKALYDYYKNCLSFLQVSQKYGIPQSTLRHWKKKVENKLKEFL